MAHSSVVINQEGMLPFQEHQMVMAIMNLASLQGILWSMLGCFSTSISAWASKVIN
jgi:hypothetical protein